MKFQEIFEPIKVKRSMLQYGYKWEVTPGDNSAKRRIDKGLFNRKEGYEVIPMIQKVVNYFEYITERDVQKVEYVIAEKLPGNVRNQEKVFNWLTEYLLQI